MTVINIFAGQVTTLTKYMTKIPLKIISKEEAAKMFNKNSLPIIGGGSQNDDGIHLIQASGKIGNKFADEIYEINRFTNKKTLIYKR